MLENIQRKEWLMNKEDFGRLGREDEVRPNDKSTRYVVVHDWNEGSFTFGVHTVSITRDDVDRWLRCKEEGGSEPLKRLSHFMLRDQIHPVNSKERFFVIWKSHVEVIAIRIQIVAPDWELVSKVITRESRP